MGEEKKPSNLNTLFLFLGFLVLFVLSFSLGVIVGKGLSGSKTRIASKERPIGTPSRVKELEKVPETAEEKLSVEQTPAPLEEEKLESKIAGAEEQAPIPSPTEETVKAEADKKEEFIQKKDVIALPKIDPEGKYTVQVGSFQSEKEAKKLVEALKSRGYPVFIKQIEISGKGTWYRVRIGTFKTRQEAKIYGDTLKNLEPVVKLVFVTVNN
jgi:cell division septation protein DedD